MQKPSGQSLSTVVEDWGVPQTAWNSQPRSLSHTGVGPSHVLSWNREFACSSGLLQYCDEQKHMQELNVAKASWPPLALKLHIITLPSTEELENYNYTAGTIHHCTPECEKRIENYSLKWAQNSYCKTILFPETPNCYNLAFTPKEKNKILGGPKFPARFQMSHTKKQEKLAIFWTIFPKILAFLEAH